jgi:hypothetical protein
MSKLVRLVDFQVSAQSAGLVAGERKPINQALFTTFEPVRLWLKDRKIQAPFRKIAISLGDETWYARAHGAVTNVERICEVIEAVWT